VPWVESFSASFRARHEERDTDDAARVLDRLERRRTELDGLFPGGAPGELTVILHAHPVALVLAEPLLLARWASTSPAGRRYLVGWAGLREIHALAPRASQGRASAVPGSRELLNSVPEALYARCVMARSNPCIPPPHSPRRLLRYLRRSWVVDGAAAWFGGQVPHARPAIARRLREGPRPAFPPSLADAGLLGATVIDLLVREEGVGSAVALVCAPAKTSSDVMLTQAFGGRAPERTEAAWRAHLERLASGTVQREATRPERASDDWLGEVD